MHLAAATSAESGPTPLILLSLSALLSLFCIVRLWQSGGSLFERLFWTFVLLLPVLGPVFFGAFFRPPPVQSPGLRCPETPGVRSASHR
jgi:hypothetical protein